MNNEQAELSVYAPPQARVADIIQPDAGQRFYVVAPRKLLVLMIATLGLYQFYWMYRHWANFRAVSGRKLLPIMRALFSIFFTHSLGNEIQTTLRDRTGQHWPYMAVATMLVIVTLVSDVLGRMAGKGIGSPYSDIATLFLLIPAAWAMHAIQNAANTACDDPEGQSNSHFSGANWAWIAIGVTIWILSIIGLTAEV